MVNYTALNETEESGGEECVHNNSQSGDVEDDPVNVLTFKIDLSLVNFISIS